MSVVVLFGSTEESRVAVTHSVAEATRRQVRLHVLAANDLAHEEAETLLPSEVGQSKVSWALHEVPANLGQVYALLDLATQVDADVIVVGTQRRSAVGKLLMGSLAQEILLGSLVPVLLVKP
uniref:universal stress protein n=1 Tax=unclassified Rhodococcus (in: high G+C Gram-positive bacteria) TaxID=192944 RepID=UPI001595816A|nr:MULTISPECIES: universal stress protein [unclassified Rhodococcus (in: high G+C Gram-positive bacteria)]